MERISFKVAKAIKEAGYPQKQTEYVYVTKDIDTFKEGELIDAFLDNWAAENVVDAPYVLDVWLWLIREKDINLSPIYWNSDKSWHVPSFIKDRCNDPEEAIISVIKFLVDNDLIK